MSETALLHELAATVDPLRGLARDAARRILEIYSEPFAVEHKPDNTPVTAADLAAHRALVAGLDIIARGIPVLSEEAADIPYAERAGWRTYWLVDPLDGTREFVRRNGEFSVNIALIHEHRPVLGLVHMPVSDATYFACDGEPAYRQDGDQVPVPIHVRRPHHRPPMVAVSRSRRTQRLQRFLNLLGPHETFSMGSSLKSCLVAEGRVDIYPCFGPTSEWDTAAAQCIVERAGGHLTDLQLRPLRYNTRESLLNPEFVTFGDPGGHWDRFIEEIEQGVK